MGRYRKDCQFKTVPLNYTDDHFYDDAAKLFVLNTTCDIDSSYNGQQTEADSEH